jgi:hypothetical protein
MAFNSLLKGEGLTLLKDNVNLAVLKLEGIEFRDLKFPAEESYRGGWKESRVRRAAGQWVPPATRRHFHPPPLPGPPACTFISALSTCLPRTLLTCSPRARVATPGLTAARMRGPGTRGSSTAGASTAGQTAPATRASGAMASCRWVGVASLGASMLHSCILGAAGDIGRLAAQAKGAALHARRLLPTASRLVNSRCAGWAAAFACAASYLARPPTSSLAGCRLCCFIAPQGYGTFESPDGARYVGNWLANLKHGIGKKSYANGDSYEGLWHNGKAEGPGRCGGAGAAGAADADRGEGGLGSRRRSGAAAQCWLSQQRCHIVAACCLPAPAGMCGTMAISMTASGAAARCTARARSNGSQASVGAALPAVLWSLVAG